MSVLTGPGTRGAPAGGAGAAARPTAPSRWERWRGPLLVAALLVALALVLALLAPRTSREPLAADSVAPEGSRALARVLQEQGVDVQPVRRFDDALARVRDAPRGATVLVTAPEVLVPERLRALADLTAGGTDLVLAAPDAPALAELAPQLRPAGTRPAAPADPGCAVPDAVAAGEVLAGGSTYAVVDGAEGAGDAAVCYGGSYAVLDPGADGPGRVVVLGQRRVLTNDVLDEDGNAALALRGLGTSPVLVWYRPDPLDTPAGQAVPLRELVPAWVVPAGVLLLLSAACVALWRGRRLGRLVPEPLPVVVRAVESVEGRGRLYAQAAARDRAAEALRAATVRRVRALVRLDPQAPVVDVAEVAAWECGRDPAAVRALLLSGPPDDDAALVRLAGELDALERDLRGR
ncbi:DUF4350 domain-containing protein [Kineococcus terrestris]|uniref:DUF4350 domain-containing protein n=1 Tax=Kineococcus terrestris TaxID=2044856 RepID=UPI0034DB5591